MNRRNFLKKISLAVGAIGVGTKIVEYIQSHPDEEFWEDFGSHIYIRDRDRFSSLNASQAAYLANKDSERLLKQVCEIIASKSPYVL